MNINCMNEQVSNTGSSGPLVFFLMNINNNLLSLIKFVVLKQKPDFSNRVLFWISFLIKTKTLDDLMNRLHR